MSAGVDAEVMLELPGGGGGGGVREREFDEIPWSNYRFKGEKDSHVVNSAPPPPAAGQTKSSIFAQL